MHSEVIQNFDRISVTKTKGNDPKEDNLQTLQFFLHVCDKKSDRDSQRYGPNG